MLINSIIIIGIIFNVLCNIKLSSQISIKSRNNDQFISYSPSKVNQYRSNSDVKIINDEHISEIFDKLGSYRNDLTTESLLTSTEIETSTYSNKTTIIPPFQTKRLPINPDVVAPDGSLVRNLLTTIGGSMAQFELPPNMISNAVEHRTVYEIWYFLSGQGQFWRKQNEREEIVIVNPNVCITIPVGTLFQFRTIGQKNLVAVAITMPPWPGEGEAIPRKGIWNPTINETRNSSIRLINSIYIFLIIINFIIVNYGLNSKQ